MEQQPEIREVLERFDKAKAEGRQPICPHCQKTFLTEQPQYISNYWQWNDKTKRYERDEPDPRTEEPFCAACRAEYRDSLYR
jgi:hypothetical protein